MASKCRFSASAFTGSPRKTPNEPSAVTPAINQIETHPFFQRTDFRAASAEARAQKETGDALFASLGAKQRDHLRALLLKLRDELGRS